MIEYPFRAIGGSAAIADGQNTSVLGLLLAAKGTTRRQVQLLIDAYYLMTASLTAVTGVGIQVSLRRITALTSGTAGAVRLMEPNAEAQAIIDELITCVTGGTTGGTNTAFAYRAINNDEVSLTGQSDLTERAIWQAGSPDDALVITPGNAAAGTDIFQVTNSTVGGWIPEIRGRIRIG